MDLSIVGQDVALCCPHPLSLKEVLQLRLQNRKNLGQRANMPSMKNIPNFIETRTCLQQINADDPLKHKMRTYSHPSDLMPLDIFEDETPASLETRQKRARLANNLSDKILHRPGPLELLEKNILPLHPPVDSPQGVIEMGLSQPDTQLHESADLSARQNGVHTTPGCATSTEGGTSAPESGRGPGKHALHTTPAITSRIRPCRKVKEVKPKVKKLKYHQYIPPEQRGAAINSPALDVEYSRLLQQQQLYLQLQIIGQQQQSLALPSSPHPSRGLHTEPLLGFTATLPTFLPTLPLAPSPRSQSATTPSSCQKPELLPPKLEDLTVSELRQQLRKRGLPVSGTKPALLERLKPFRAPPPQLGTPPPSLPTPSALPKERVVERLAQKLRLDALPVPLPPSPLPLIPPSPPGTSFSSDPIDDSKPPVCLSLSPASLHSLFPMEDMEFESRSDSGSQERFGNEIFLGSDSRESIPPSRRSGIETLEEELTEAIRSAELSDSTSIEDILDEPFISNGSSSDGLSPPSLSPSSGLSPSPLSSTPSPTYPCLPAPLPPPLDLLAPSPPSAEISLDPCDWADRAGGYGHSSTFTVDFLDAPDLNINRMIDLLVEQW